MTSLDNYKKPRRFDFNMIVIGAGSAGLVSAYIAAAVNAKVALIEKHKMGGDCLNTGCVPSKALIRSAKIMHYAKRAQDFGFTSAEVKFDFAQVMQRVQQVISKVEPHDSVQRYTDLGVDCFQAEAKLLSPWHVELSQSSAENALQTKVISGKNIVIATGARPFVPDFPGLEQVPYYTSDSIWSLRQQPKKLLVLGGGPIGSELAQAFHRLGSQVTIVERGQRILSKEDPDTAAWVEQSFIRDGIELKTAHQVERFEKHADHYQAICRHQDKKVCIEFDAVLIALGRSANISGFGLDGLGVKLSPRHTVETDQFMRTNYSNIYACGDVAGPYQFTHTAAHQAWYVAVNALFSPFKKFAVNYSAIPWATFTDPEVAQVGLNETMAKAGNIPYEVTQYGIDDLDRAIADDEDRGFVKVLTKPGKDRILGVTIVGAHAGDLIAEYVFAMTHGLGLNKVLGTIHIYPTLAEANKYAAGAWKKAHKPEGLLAWLKKFHAWRRG
jgi:dihydrolipoamide dehydrogenase